MFHNIRCSKTIIDVQWVFSSFIIAAAFQFILRIILGQELGAPGLGLYTLAFTVYMFGMQFGSLGIGEALIKYVAQYNNNFNKTREFVSVGTFSAIFTGIIMTLLLYIFSPWIASDIFHNFALTNLLKITSICFPFIAMQRVVFGTLNGLRKMRHFSAIYILQNILMLALTLIFVSVLKMGTIGAVIGYVIPTILIGILCMSIIKNYFILKLNIHSPILRELTSFGIFVILSNSSGIINTQVSSILVGHYIGVTDVGYYTVSVVLLQGIVLFPTSMQRVINPIIADYYSNHNYRLLNGLLKRTMLYTFLITLLLSALLCIFGKFLIVMLFGSEFVPAYIPLLILIIGNIIYAPILSVSGVTTNIGKIDITFKYSVFSAFFTTLLNIILIPPFGLLGAAIATTISLIILSIIYLVIIKTLLFDHRT